MEIIDILENMDFFNGVSQHSKEELASICIPRMLKKNEVLFSEGDPGNFLYILATGSIRIYKSGDSGRETVIKIIKPGELFAEVVLFETDIYPVSATAMKTSSIYGIQKKRFHSLLDAKDFRNDFMLTLMRKQRYLTKKLHDITASDAEERFLGFLTEYYGRKNEYRIYISKKDIASAIGTAPETLSRLLKKMRRDGKIEVDGNVIRILKNRV
ncbi:MAG TPA: hypothetical protein DCO75_03030 [Fibrobacteres bacterium]|jgi:CRP/FNR family transcriptional regulator, dissimilatory nitrate respiration regulator|nr:hypothetical protein [Fibrobacterota bacterium]